MKRVFNFYISTHSLTRRLTSETDVYTIDCSISTHSLTRRLTLSANITQTKQNYFNSQPHKEADEDTYTEFATLGAFQLTASQGG